MPAGDGEVGRPGEPGPRRSRSLGAGSSADDYSRQLTETQKLLAQEKETAREGSRESLDRGRHPRGFAACEVEACAEVSKGLRADLSREREAKQRLTQDLEQVRRALHRGR